MPASDNDDGVVPHDDANGGDAEQEKTEEERHDEPNVRAQQPVTNTDEEPKGEGERKGEDTTATGNDDKRAEEEEEEEEGKKSTETPPQSDGQEKQTEQHIEPEQTTKKDDENDVREVKIAQSTVAIDGADGGDDDDDTGSDNDHDESDMDMLNNLRNSFAVQSCLHYERLIRDEIVQERVIGMNNLWGGYMKTYIELRRREHERMQCLAQRQQSLRETVRRRLEQLMVQETKKRDIICRQEVQQLEAIVAGLERDIRVTIYQRGHVFHQQQKYFFKALLLLNQKEGLMRREIENAEMYRWKRLLRVGDKEMNRLYDMSFKHKVQQRIQTLRLRATHRSQSHQHTSSTASSARNLNSKSNNNASEEETSGSRALGRGAGDGRETETEEEDESPLSSKPSSLERRRPTIQLLAPDAEEYKQIGDDQGGSTHTTTETKATTAIPPFLRSKSGCHYPSTALLAQAETHHRRLLEKREVQMWQELVREEERWGEVIRRVHVSRRNRVADAGLQQLSHLLDNSMRAAQRQWRSLLKAEAKAREAILKEERTGSTTIDHKWRRDTLQEYRRFEFEEVRHLTHQRNVQYRMGRMHTLWDNAIHRQQALVEELRASVHAPEDLLPRSFPLFELPPPTAPPPPPTLSSSSRCLTSHGTEDEGIIGQQQGLSRLNMNVRAVVAMEAAARSRILKAERLERFKALAGEQLPDNVDDRSLAAEVRRDEMAVEREFKAADYLESERIMANTRARVKVVLQHIKQVLAEGREEEKEVRKELYREEQSEREAITKQRLREQRLFVTRDLMMNQEREDRKRLRQEEGKARHLFHIAEANAKKTGYLCLLPNTVSAPKIEPIPPPKSKHDFVYTIPSSTSRRSGSSSRRPHQNGRKNATMTTSTASSATTVKGKVNHRSLLPSLTTHHHHQQQNSYRKSSKDGPSSLVLPESSERSHRSSNGMLSRAIHIYINSSEPVAAAAQSQPHTASVLRTGSTVGHQRQYTTSRGEISRATATLTTTKGGGRKQWENSLRGGSHTHCGHPETCRYCQNLGNHSGDGHSHRVTTDLADFVHYGNEFSTGATLRRKMPLPPMQGGTRPRILSLDGAAASSTDVPSSPAPPTGSRQRNSSTAETKLADRKRKVQRSASTMNAPSSPSSQKARSDEKPSSAPGDAVPDAASSEPANEEDDSSGLSSPDSHTNTRTKSPRPPPLPLDGGTNLYLSAGGNNDHRPRSRERLRDRLDSIASPRTPGSATVASPMYSPIQSPYTPYSPFSPAASSLGGASSPAYSPLDSPTVYSPDPYTPLASPTG